MFLIAAWKWNRPDSKPTTAPTTVAPQPSYQNNPEMYTYLGLFCPYTKLYASHLLAKKKKIDIFKKNFRLTQDGHNVRINLHSLLLDDLPHIPVFIGVYPKDSELMKGRDGRYTEGVGPDGVREYRGVVSERAHFIAIEYGIKESVMWVTLHDIAGEKEIWEMHKPVDLIARAIKYLKSYPKVHIDRFYLVGDGPGGDFVLNTAGPQLRHYLAGVGATNCSTLSPNFQLHYVNFPCAFHMAPNAAKVAYSDSIAENRLFPEKFQKYVERLPQMLENSHSIFEKVYERLVRPNDFLTAAEEAKLEELASEDMLVDNIQDVFKARLKKRIATPKLLCWYRSRGWTQKSSHWLSANPSSAGGDVLIVARRHTKNQVEVVATGVSEVVILMQEPFFWLEDPITFTFNGLKAAKKLAWPKDLAEAKKTVAEVEDPSLIYSFAVKLSIISGSLRVTTTILK